MVKLLHNVLLVKGWIGLIYTLLTLEDMFE